MPLEEAYTEGNLFTLYAGVLSYCKPDRLQEYITGDKIIGIILFFHG
jgi:hypothetical protein